MRRHIQSIYAQLALSRSIILGCLVLGCVALSACAPQQAAHDMVLSPERSMRNIAWLDEGSITIARPIPTVTALSASKILAFLPATLNAPAIGLGSNHSGFWLSVERASSSQDSGRAFLMNGDEMVREVSVQGSQSLSTGVFRLVHKQRSPLWYAPNGYFEARGLALPPQGDKARYLRGALGEFVLFLNQDTPIHSGPIWSEEIGGLKVDESELSRVYYQLEIGTVVEVK